MTRRAIGIALLVGGVILLVFGFNESESFASEVSEVFTGSPTDRSIWMIVVGSATAVAGLVMAVLPGSSR
jgi:ABC-type enterochelin transport system permease subunit